jgi:hypothetical protein
MAELVAVKVDAVGLEGGLHSLFEIALSFFTRSVKSFISYSNR